MSGVGSLYNETTKEQACFQSFFCSSVRSIPFSLQLERYPSKLIALLAKLIFFRFFFSSSLTPFFLWLDKKLFQKCTVNSTTQRTDRFNQIWLKDRLSFSFFFYREDDLTLILCYPEWSHIHTTNLTRVWYSSH